MWQAADGAFGMLRDLKSENFEAMLGKFSTVCTGKAELCNERAEASDGQHLSEEIL